MQPTEISPGLESAAAQRVKHVHAQTHQGMPSLPPCLTLTPSLTLILNLNLALSRLPVHSLNATQICARLSAVMAIIITVEVECW